MIFTNVVIFACLFYVGAILLLYRGLFKIRHGGNFRYANSFSVIISARNEEQNIKASLETVLSQTISQDNYEVIVVDDRSDDATPDILLSLQRKYPILSIIKISSTPQGWSPKKYAVSQAIAAAHHEVLVFTDADCLVPDTWLETIDRHFNPQCGFLQGITSYSTRSTMNALFFGLQAIDFLSHNIVSAAAIGAGIPVNSNANNMAVRKSAYTQAGGYGEYSSIVSGDDDLLLQRIDKNQKWRIHFMADIAGAVTTSPTQTIGELLDQRKRWGSKTIHYNPRQVMFLSGIFLFYSAIVAVGIGGIFNPALFLLCGSMLILKFSGEMIILWKGTALFNQKQLRRYILIASLLQLPLVLFSVLGGIWGRFSWKGQSFSRKVP